MAVRSCRLVAAIGAAAVVIATAVYSRRRATLCLWWIQQRRLRRRLIETDLVDAEAVLLVGGVDVSFIKDSETDACAAIVVCSLPSLEVVYERYERVVLKAPYIPGYLAFREVDFLVSLLAELQASQPRLFPQVVLVDGNGILHPNRFGLACHLGVLAGVATVGVGKTLHCVDGLTREGLQRLTQAGCARAGDSADLLGDSGAVWGAALRTTDPDPKRAPKGAGTGGNALFKPVLVSIGHGLSLASALKLVRRCISTASPSPCGRRISVRENGCEATLEQEELLGTGPAAQRGTGPVAVAERLPQPTPTLPISQYRALDWSVRYPKSCSA